MVTTVQVRTARLWYEECGDGPPLVLVHGGFVDARFFKHNVEALASRFHVVTADLRGHGHTPDADGPLTYELLADDLIDLLEKVVVGPAHLLGHSMGAATVLTVALRRPDLVHKLVLVSGLFRHDGIIPGLAEQVSVDDVVAEFGAAYGEVSPDGEEHFPTVVRKVRALGRREPALTEDDLGRVACRTLVMAGDDDMISLDHTAALYRGIPDSELAIVPGTSHALLHEKPDLCHAIIVPFLAHDPVPTLSPIRRAPKPGPA